MSWTVFKYPLPVESLVEVKMPAGAQVLTAQVQDETVTLWARVDTAQPDERRWFRLVPTGGYAGGHVGERATYVGTCQLEGGAFVLHVFEVDGPR